jgi:hypothetical protein
MRAEVKRWPPSEQDTGLRLGRELQDIDERVHQLLKDLITAEH